MIAQPFQIQFLVAWLCLLATTATARGQVQIQLNSSESRCFGQTVTLESIATVTTNDARMSKMINSLDVDMFGENQKHLRISKAQVRIRLALAGLQDDQIELFGPEHLNVVAVEQLPMRESLTQALEVQLAEHFQVSPNDLKISLDPRFESESQSILDFETLVIDQNFQSEIPLGRQTIAVLVKDTSGKTVDLNVPVSVAVMRDMVVAKKNISKGQILGPENINAVRRPVSSWNVRFASYEQVVGSQVQKDIQQYEAIKSNLVQTARANSDVAIKRNSLVNIVARCGPVAVRLRGAKALGSGNPGDLIEFINPKTKERIVAKVVNSSTAEICH